MSATDVKARGLLVRAADWLLGTGAADPQASFNVSDLQGEQLQEFLRIGGGAEASSGAYVNDSTAMKVAVFWRASQIISGAVAGVATDIVRRVSEKERLPAVGHPLRRVMTVKPNQWQTPHEFKRLMQMHLLLRGNAYALKVMAGGTLLALIPMRPDRVIAEQLDSGKMQYRYTRNNGSLETLRQDQVLHLRGISLDGVTGLSPIRFMRESVGLAVSGELAAGSMMKNGQLTPGYLTHPTTLGAQGIVNLKESLKEYRNGGDNAGNWLILEEGMEAKALSLSAEDMQFIGMREFQRYDIAMFMGVPPPLLGIPNTTSNFGTGVEQQSIGFVTYNLNDWFKIWEEAIKRDCIPEGEWDTHDFRFYTQSLMRGDTKTRWETYVKAMQWGVKSPNEIRAMEDDNPRQNGDIYYDPPNMAGGADREGASDEPAQTS